MAPFSLIPRATRGQEAAMVTEKYRCVHPPSNYPLDSARHAPRTVRGYNFSCLAAG
jgi:hypothetical protein